nr:immunoglobulin light chain junction region [Macaca mulatta]
CQQYDNPPWTF